MPSEFPASEVEAVIAASKPQTAKLETDGATDDAAAAADETAEGGDASAGDDTTGGVQ